MRRLYLKYVSTLFAIISWDLAYGDAEVTVTAATPEPGILTLNLTTLHL